MNKEIGFLIKMFSSLVQVVRIFILITISFYLINQDFHMKDMLLSKQKQEKIT